MPLALSLALQPIDAADPAAVEALLDAAFGTDRHARTAYRVRAGTAPIAALSFAAFDDEGRLVGSLQSWPVAWIGDDGHAAPLVMTGPVAAIPALQKRGIGRTLLAHATAAADRIAAPPQMLIGDAPYYAPFGYSADRTRHWRLPGPFERDRLLARGAAPAGAGTIAPPTTAHGLRSGPPLP